MNRIKTYHFSPLEEQAIIAYLHDELGLSDLSEALGHKRRSPQPAINSVAYFCRQWVIEGKLVIKQETGI